MLPLKAMISTAGGAGEEDDPVGEDELVAAVGHLAREVAVAGDDRREGGEPGVGGVGGEHEDAERGELDDPEQHVLAAEDVLGHEGDAGRVVFAAVRLEVRRQHRDAEEAGAEDGPHDRQRQRGVAALGLAERLHAVGHRLDTRQCDGARRERPQEHEQRQRLRPVGEVLRFLGQLAEGDLAEVAEEHAEQADDDEHGEHEDVEVRRRGEHATGLAHAAQVGDGDHADDHQTERDAQRLVEVERRLHRQHAAGDGHGDGQDVVGEQRRAGHQRRRLAEVGLGHDVGAAARRVGVDRLAVREDDDEEQDGDDDRPAARGVRTRTRRPRPGSARR